MTPAGFFLHAWCAKTWQQGKTGQFLAARSIGLAFSAKTDGHGRTKHQSLITDPPQPYCYREPGRSSLYHWEVRKQQATKSLIQ